MLLNCTGKWKDLILMVFTENFCWIIKLLSIVAGKLLLRLAGKINYCVDIVQDVVFCLEWCYLKHYLHLYWFSFMEPKRGEAHNKDHLSPLGGSAPRLTDSDLSEFDLDDASKSSLPKYDSTQVDTSLRKYRPGDSAGLNSASGWACYTYIIIC